MSLLAELAKKRKPAQEEPAQEELVLEELIIDGSTPVEYGEPVSMPDLEVDVNPNPNLPKDEIGRDLRSALIDAFVGGAPGLLSTLGGASPYVQNMQYDKGNQYAQKRSQDELNAKLVQLKSADGTPYYEKARYAVGEEPYIAVKKTADQQRSLGQDKGRFQAIPFYDPQSKSYKTKTFDTSTGQYVDELGAIARPSSPKTSQMRTLEGGTNLMRVNPYAGGPETIASQPGIGNELLGKVPDNRLSKERANQMLKEAGKAKDKVIKYMDAKKSAESALADLTDPNPTPEQMGKAAMQIAKAINKERLSDQDFRILLGSEYKSYASDIEAFLAGKLTGSATPRFRQSLIKIANKLVNESNNMIRNMQNLYAAPGSIPSAKGQKIIDRAAGKPTTFEERKKKLKEIK